jgi:CBS domain-containing protein
MIVGDICSREVYVVKRDEPLAEAAREMRSRHVGAVVVAEGTGELLRPIGIVTDRDIVCGQIDRRADLFCLSVGDVMTPDPISVSESAELAEAVESLSRGGVRRAPVIDETGHLVGIVTLDDLLPAVAEQLGGLAKLIGSQAKRERRGRGQTAT